MKVKLCTQVFSHSVGSLLTRIPGWDIKDKNKLGPEAESTGELILFLDKLFDSLNCLRYSKMGNAAKPLKCPMTRNSGHKSFWLESQKIIQSMKFFSHAKQTFVNVPTLKNLNFTLKGFLRLTDKLFDNAGCKFVLTGAFNQDALENFFSYIRAHCLRNTNPSQNQFMASFKTLMMNNFTAVHSPGANCKRDCSEGLDNLRSLLTGGQITDVLATETNEEVVIPKDVLLQKTNKIGSCITTYMCGVLIKIVQKNRAIKKCEKCMTNLKIRHLLPNHYNDELITAKQFEKGNLIRPGDLVIFLIRSSFDYLSFLTPQLATSKIRP
ncbi:uncharacterized protein LOC126741462 isoform X2 [Anthonomus grandis grandis]|uniref:uncharacterized protein LOC126741462 isoform X2 n=1 Tax=Anthonomus grandis grandis TaxID=2921223 RepID=UPI002166918C|nr:uncharacterized protein LOC126741462 isoform X2 [Anthonomus grandis grandis]